MSHLPLFVPTPDEPALLPGERRRIELSAPRMQTAARLASRGGGEIAFLAWDTAQRKPGPEETPAEELLLPVATRARVLEAVVEGDGGWMVVRGIERITVEVHEHGGCCAHDDPWTEGTEVACTPIAPGEEPEAGWVELRSLLRELDLAPRLRGRTIAERIDRLAAWMALPAWVQGEVLAQSDPARRIERIADHARELSAPGASFRANELGEPWRNDEAYFEDLVRHYDCRARALRSPIGEGARLCGHGRRRQAALLRVRASRARIERRREEAERLGTLPPLEKLRRAHELAEGAVDALLVAGLGGHQRFGPRLQQAARMLPPEELPLGAWIAALEGGIFGG